MRKIQFRGLYKGTMVYGNLIQGTGLNGEKITQIERSDANDFAKYDVDPETVGQLTGRTDNEGKDIYEGDIIEFDKEEWGSDNNKFQVEWDEYNSEWSWGGGCNSDMGWRRVIGNIHENKELLK